MTLCNLSRIALVLALLVPGSVHIAHADTTISTAPTNGLVGYWSFNEGTSTRATDLSRYKNNGTLQNGPTWVNGRVGGGVRLSLTSSDGKEVQVAQSASVNNIVTKTIAFWLKPGSGGASSQFLINKTAWNISYLSSNRVQIYETFAGGTEAGQWRPSTSGIVPINKWTHVAITYDKSSPSNVPIIYINGASTSISTLLTPSGSYDSDSSDILYIGGDANSPGTNNFVGIIDEVRIYNRILTPAEIQKTRYSNRSSRNSG